MSDHDPDHGPASPNEYDDESNPASPGSVDESSEASTPMDPPSSGSDAMPGFTPEGDLPRRVPSLRTISDPQHTNSMSPSSSVPGTLNAARRPAASAANLPTDLMAKARALHQQRMGMAPRPSMSPQNSGLGMGPMGSGMGGMGSMGGMGHSMNLNMNHGGPAPGGLPGGLRLPPGIARPPPQGFPKSAPAIAGLGAKKAPSLSERRAMKLGGLPGGPGSPVTATPKLSDMGAEDAKAPAINGEGRGSKLSDFKNYIDAEKGWITFADAATITRTGVNFANGQTFRISLDEVEVMDELGKGNYGTVYKVRHSKVMAMKEIRLELDESKFSTILKELVILHECASPYIIDFYGAFYQEGAVYMCIEYMDGGSIDKLYAGGIPENVLRKITYATIMGLKCLKEDHNIIHRDVKPTNILVNTNGQVKICDFGVSGNLVASIAKTNIGCQSYMAPERISGGGMSAAGGAAAGTYSVQSDIWSLGLTIIECAMGRYPYPPEVSSTIFSQLSAIVEGDPPGLPSEGYSGTAQDFVKSCLNKIPAKRHTYPMLLMHPWIKSLGRPETITEEVEAEEKAADDQLADATGSLDINSNGPINDQGDREVAEWVTNVLDRKLKGLLSDKAEKPALHAAPLDQVSPGIAA
uniref:mitogen-activated protein kinase kinase n=1 Tax=Neurospora crassa TaxID=5141 RepID=F5HAW4_NEUCS|nr:putative PBS2 like MAPK kinase [Neurospora crassa]